MRAAVDPLQAYSQLLFEILADVLDHAGLGRRGQADQGGRLAVARVFPDETGDVAVVRPEIVPPFGHTMGFVDDPVSDFPLLQDRPHRRVSQLFRRDEQHRRIAEADLVEGVVAFGERQQAVDGHA